MWDPDEDLDAHDDVERRVLDDAIVCTAFALAVAAIAGEHVIGSWAAGWAYLVAIALAAWARSWLVVPTASAAVIVQLVEAEHVIAAIGGAAAELAIAAIVVVVVWAVRGNTERMRALLRDD